MKGMGWGKWALGMALSASVASAAVVVSEELGRCEESSLNSDLPVYKDPTLFLSTLKVDLGRREANLNSMLSESPLLTTVRGRVSFMRLGPDQPFKNFSSIAKLYELTDPHLKLRTEQAQGTKGKDGQKNSPLIMPILFCNPHDAYADTMGFILVDDLKEALRARNVKKGSLPPSGYPNPVPEWKKPAG